MQILIALVNHDRRQELKISFSKRIYIYKNVFVFYDSLAQSKCELCVFLLSLW